MLNFQDWMAPVTGSQNMRVPPWYFSAGSLGLCTNHNYRTLGHTVGCKDCSRRIFRTVSHDAPQRSLLLLTLLILLTTRLLQKILLLYNLSFTWVQVSCFFTTGGLSLNLANGIRVKTCCLWCHPDLESDNLTKKCLAWWGMIIRVARIRTSMLTIALVNLLWPVSAFYFSFGFLWNVNML